MDAVVAWTEQRIVNKMDPAMKKNLEQFSEIERRRRVIYFTTQRWKELGPGNLPPLSEAELRKLREMLSPSARQHLDQALAHPQKYHLQQLVMGWVRQSLSQFVSTQVGQRMLADATDEHLKKFFEDELSESERERLLSLPADEMQRQLRRAFLMSRKPSEGRPFRQNLPQPRSAK